ncbi:hypothetical protein GGS23DRAFT_85397 [Durotheca rogersii]|uniref:uncharacterized protein n=1 Tax=Durotheca rogersii TaxID=419775 RepID=UPI00221F2771|nr:uncharacterized protein GGS23DRAFT_85397 [Durotheca rogersii]KAI5862639.1 hypothetical protein GGS23DRAFT_85397 [Durotheca rogersii]
MPRTRDTPQSFEDREFFPAFRDCPAEHEWDDRYFIDSVPGIGVNRKHWCLLGEIIQADTRIRPRIVAKDYRGEDFVVALYPDDEDDTPRLLRQFKVGNTIAIFYALTHGFLDGTIGVRVESTDECLIIPLNFKDVLKMNSELIKYTPANGTLRKCHGCEAADGQLNKCGQCTLFFYCNRECQTKAWTEKNHKKHCKALKDKNVRFMHFLDYATHDGNISLS